MREPTSARAARGFRARLQRAQERWSDPLLTVLMVLMLLLFFVAVPLQATGSEPGQMLGAVVLLGIMACALVMSGNPWVFALLLVGLVMNGTAVVLRLHTPSRMDIMLAAGGWLILSVVLGSVVARLVFGPGRVNTHRVIGAVLLYLLVAAAFVAVYAFVGLFIPNAFAGLEIVDSPSNASNLIYFSFVTLTSTGYGDIAPVHPIARACCNIETIIGQLYPATLLARLVTLELEHRRERIAGRDASRGEHPGRGRRE
ncbi:potassium channel family protein [Rhodoplanes elegans]|nr:potassium channel family protein [Rhodoplanes elegans]